MRVRLTVLATVFAKLLGIAGAVAQQPELRHPQGLTPTTSEEALAVPAVELTRAYIPEAIDLSDRFPEPASQGQIGSCVSWATAYAARSYYNFIESGSKIDDKTRIGSPAYLHEHIRNRQTTCEDGGANL